MATQGDSPVVVVNLLERGLDIESVDESGKTPLHHAATHGTEVAACYLIAYGANVEARDNEGNTPLLWAIRNAGDEDTLDIFKKLLMAGADRKTVNNKGETPQELIKEWYEYELDDEATHRIKKMEKILNSPYTMMHCLMLRNHYSLPVRSRITLYCYLAFMLIVFAVMQLCTYPVLRRAGGFPQKFAFIC